MTFASYVMVKIHKNVYLASNSYILVDVSCPCYGLWLSMVYRWRQMFWISGMALEPKSTVKISYYAVLNVSMNISDRPSSTDFLFTKAS